MVNKIIEEIQSRLEDAANNGKRVSVGFYTFNERVGCNYIVDAGEVFLSDGQVSIESGHYNMNFQFGKDVRIDKIVGIDMEYGFIDENLCLYLCILGTE